MGTILYRTLMMTCSLCLCSGCTQSLNDRMTLGGTYHSPTFVDHSLSIHEQQSNGLNTLAMTGSTDRSHWVPAQYVSPMDGVVHSRLWRVLHPVSKKDPPRTYGRFPLATDVLNSQSTKSLNDTLNTIDDIGRSIIGTPYALGYMTVTGSIGRPSISPVSPWKRTNSTNTWSSGFPASTKEHNDPSLEKE